MDDKIEPIAYSPRAFARVCGISVSLLYRLWRDGRGPPFTLLYGRRVIERESGQHWLRQPHDVGTEKERKKAYLQTKLRGVGRMHA